MKDLKLMVLNAQDLFLFMDKLNTFPASALELSEIQWQLMSSSLFPNKTKEKCQILAQTIMDSHADIVMMTEVGGIESLKNFSCHFLNDNYLAFSLPSNSDRGIDLGYLVKRSLPYHFDVRSYKKYPLPQPARRFSRDVLRLDIKKNSKLKTILLLVHIKSKLDLKKNDFEGRTRREQEIKGLMDIYLKLKKQHPNTPILVGGDFNGHAEEIDTEEEFKQIYELTDLKDVASIADISLEDRFSYVYFSSTGESYHQHIDYLFISNKFSDRIVKEGCFFPRYKYLNQSLMPIPQNISQKSLLPSDHYPFFVTFKI